MRIYSALGYFGAMCTLKSLKTLWLTFLATRYILVFIMHIIGLILFESARSMYIAI